MVRHSTQANTQIFSHSKAAFDLHYALCCLYIYGWCMQEGGRCIRHQTSGTKRGWVQITWDKGSFCKKLQSSFKASICIIIQTLAHSTPSATLFHRFPPSRSAPRPTAPDHAAAAHRALPAIQMARCTDAPLPCCSRNEFFFSVLRGNQTKSP